MYPIKITGGSSVLDEIYKRWNVQFGTIERYSDPSEQNPETTVLSSNPKMLGTTSVIIKIAGQDVVGKVMEDLKKLPVIVEQLH